MREIKFRAWDKKLKKWVTPNMLNNPEQCTVRRTDVGFRMLNEDESHFVLGQSTGLLDKNEPCKEVYEGDIIDVYGKIKGNIYEIKEVDKDQYDLVIQGFGTKDWLTTYQNAVDRGCKDSE